MDEQEIVKKAYLAFVRENGPSSPHGELRVVEDRPYVALWESKRKVTLLAVYRVIERDQRPTEVRRLRRWPVGVTS